MKDSVVKEEKISTSEEIKDEKKNKDKKEEDKKVSKSEQKNKEVEKSKKTKKKRNSILIAIIIGILVILGIVISTIFALLNIRNDKIVSGVSISGIEVSGLSKEEAKGKIEAMYQEKKEEEIDIKYEDFETTLNPTLLEVNYNIDKAIEDAYLVGRKDNIFFNNYDILYTLLCKKNINVDMTLNEEVAKQNIEDIGVNLPGVVVESSYSVEDDELIITKGKAGVKIDTEKLLDEIKERLNDVNLKEEIIEIPVLNKEPESIDIDKIHEEIYTEAKDAYYTKNPFAVYPEVEGIDFDVEEAKALLEEEKEEYVIKLKITKPKVTISQIGSEAFPDQLATFTTRFDVSDVDRSTNLKIACQKINGKVILSGDTFSYNKALGARTAAAGYKNGKIYSGGQVVDGIGGGICQISSTLYNSVLLADLEIVERRNHQFVTSYVGPGRDATVVYGLTDFKFKNTRQYPVRISASARNGIATISIYGIKEENEYTTKYIENINNHLGIGPLPEEGERLLNELKLLFLTDGKSDKDLITGLIAGYRNALMNNYDINIIEIKKLIEIKKENKDTFYYIKNDEGSYFSPSNGSIFCENANTNTLLHETGHALHFYIADMKTPDDYQEIVERARENPEVLAKTKEYAANYRKLINNITLLVEQRYDSFFKSYYSPEKVEEIKKNLTKSKEEKKKEYKELHIPDEQLDMILSDMYTQEEYIDHQKRIFIEDNVDAILRNEFGSLLPIGDILDAIYEGKLHSNTLKDSQGEAICKTGGHGLNYYYATLHGFDEMIANFAAISKANDAKEKLKMLKSIVGDEVYDMIRNFYYQNILKINLEENKVYGGKR